MEQIRIEPYIFFKKQAKEAMEFYKDVFGGELTMQTLGESPKEALEQMKIDKSRYDEVMHARLKGGSFNLMASDSNMASPEAKKVSLSIGGTDEAAMREIFKKLSADGKVIQPLEKMFWGDLFGSLTDKYGVEWMMNIGDSMS